MLRTALLYGGAHEGVNPLLHEKRLLLLLLLLLEAERKEIRQQKRETTLREDASRNFGVTRRRGAAVPVEVDPARGHPDQQRRAGEWIHTQAMSWGVVMICLNLDMLRSSTPLYHHLVGRNLRLLPGQETLGTTPKE